jgi:hypothetical protein
MFKEVFISHAKEDYKVAERLYEYLLQKGYSPWLDKKKLKVGANWEYEIRKALKESTFVILLLSSISVKKRGYVQKEFKYAVEYSENKLIDDIYIIPILLDKCEVPDILSKFQWIEIGNENLIEEILNSLNSQRQKYLGSLSPELIEINDYTSFSINLNINIPNNIEYLCDLPLFYENNFFDVHFVNTFIQQKALEVISEHRKWINADLDYFKGREHPFYFEISHAIKKLDKDFLSLTIFYNSDFGGVHPNTNVDTLNFAFHPDRILRFRDIVKYNNINEFIKDRLLKYGNKEQKECLEKYIEYLTEDNIDFNFDDETLEIDFTNQIPRVILALGTLEIPMKDITKST